MHIRFLEIAHCAPSYQVKSRLTHRSSVDHTICTVNVLIDVPQRRKYSIALGILLMNKPTVHDIARVAGVSLATVDRVLNARPGVRENTILKVREAVSRLGYVRDTSAANLSRQRQYKFAFLLPDGSGQFAATLKEAVRAAAKSQLADRVAIKVHGIPANDPHAIVRILRSLASRDVDGVAIMAQETPQVRDAIIRLKERGTAVVALVSDLPNAPRDNFVGIDNIAAGRTAGLLMGRFLSRRGKILVVTNSMQSRDSLERRLGFDSVLASEFPSLTALPSIESFDDPDRVVRIVREAVQSRPGLAGVYSMGLGNGPLLTALRETETLKELVVLAHELTPTTRQALIDNDIAAVIMQDVGHLVRSTIRILRAVRDQQPIFDAQERIRIEVILRENLPEV
ncbi:MAG: LacI family DNA-binding transcriptional regulator [Pseudomonadota bacterium]